MEKLDYPDEIVKGYDRYMKVIERNNEGIEHSYGKEYERRERNIKIAGNKFEKLCKDMGFNYLTVHSNLINTKLRIN